jgi:outer membrane protein
MKGCNRPWEPAWTMLCFLFFAVIPPCVFAEEPSPMSGPTVTAPEPASGQYLSGQMIIRSGDTLALNQCIEIALKENPDIQAAAGTVNISSSRVGQARSAYYPQINASAAYAKGVPVTGARSTSTVSGSSAGSGLRYEQYAGSITLNQNILDFRTSSLVDVAKYRFESSRADLITVENNVVLMVKQAYYGVLQAKRNKDVAADVIKQFELHLEQAQGFYEVGTRARIDVIKAEVDLSNARLNLINAENSLKIAWVNLNNAMGVPDAPLYAIEDNLSFHAFDIGLEEATRMALINRPDLRSIIAGRQAAESNVSVARSGYYPVLSGSAGYNKSGTDLHTYNLNEGWQAGVLLTIPVFEGFLTSHQVAEAKSNVYVLKANEESLRQQILLEVRQAYLNIEAAEASISTTELAAKQAKENLDLANGRYAAGVGSPVEVSDAFATYISAQANHTSALANYKIARAAIENAMGLR